MTSSIIPFTPQQRISTLLIGGNELNTVKELAKIAKLSGLAKVSQEIHATFIMLKGLELGVQPFQALDSIFMVEGKDKSGNPQLSLGLTVGLMLSLVQSSKELEDIQMPDPSTITDSATVTVKRRGQSPFTFTFTKTMAQGQYLLDKGNWKKMFQIMMLNRAISGALRPVFADVLKGMYLYEEIAPDVEQDETGAPVEAPRLPVSSNGSSQAPSPADASTPQLENTENPDELKWYAAPDPRSKSGRTGRETIIQWCREQLDSPNDADILRYANITALDDMSTETGWGQYDSGKAAWEAIQTRYNAEVAEKSQPPPANTLEARLEAARQQLDLSTAAFDALYAALPGMAIVDNSTVAEIVNAIQMQQRRGSGGQNWTDFDEYALIELAKDYGLGSIPEVLLALDKAALRDLGTPHQARLALTRLAIERKKQLTVRHLVYMGQYSELVVGDLRLRVYGRDDFRALEGTAVKTDCENWVKGKAYGTADNTLADVLAVKEGMWAAPKNSQAADFFVVEKGGLTLGSIPF